MSRVRDKTTQPLYLNFKSGRPVFVTTEDEDRFLTTEREAAEACRTSENVRRWSTEFQAFLLFIRSWCEEHPKIVANSYVAIDDGLKVFVVTKGGEYRFDLDDDVTDLDVKLSEEFPVCPCDVLQLPENVKETLASFFSAERALQVYKGKPGSGKPG